MSTMVLTLGVPTGIRSSKPASLKVNFMQSLTKIPTSNRALTLLPFVTMSQDDKTDTNSIVMNEISMRPP